MSESEKEFVILVTLLRYDDKLNYFWRKCEWCFLWQKSALGSHWIIDNTCNINTISIMTVLVVNTSNSPIAHIFCLILSLIFDWNRCVKRYVMAQCPCREDLQRVVFTEKWSSCPFCWKHMFTPAVIPSPVQSGPPGTQPTETHFKHSLYTHRQEHTLQFILHWNTPWAERANAVRCSYTSKNTR